MRVLMGWGRGRSEEGGGMNGGAFIFGVWVGNGNWEWE
jgi:hypothetical protein